MDAQRERERERESQGTLGLMMIMTVLLREFDKLAEFPHKCCQ